MENIEIGEYIRVYGILGKITKKENGNWYKWKKQGNIYNSNIKIDECRKVKHSKQLIDLIEPGDLCYYKLRDSDKVCKNFAVMNHLGKIQLYFYSLDQLKIIKILTHEKIEANCYKVGGEDEC